MVFNTPEILDLHFTSSGTGNGMRYLRFDQLPAEGLLELVQERGKVVGIEGPRESTVLGKVARAIAQPRIRFNDQPAAPDPDGVEGTTLGRLKFRVASTRKPCFPPAREIQIRNAETVIVLELDSDEEKR